MSKSRNFSIYLLKNNFSSKNALKYDHSLGEPVKAAVLPDNASLYLMDKDPTPPWWKSYWGIDQELEQTLKGAIVFLPVKNRCFVICFGHTYHKLKPESYEYDFGLKTTLNAIDPEKIKSTDILQPENAKRQRIQSSTPGDLTFFDFNRNESIIKKLTGAVKEEYKEILSNITGASNLKISSKIKAQNISNLCEKLLAIYDKDDYQKSFPDLHNISPIKDPVTIEELNRRMVEDFHRRLESVVLAIPEIIDYQESHRYSFRGGRTNGIKYEDVYIDNYREFLSVNQMESATMTNLKNHRLVIEDENGNKKNIYSVFKCLLYDCVYSGEHYHLCEGEWYRIDKNYIKFLKTKLDCHFEDYDELGECDQKTENEYNQKIAESNRSFVCLDKTNIAPKGQTQVEPCDLYTTHNHTAHLIHIKISTRSAALSHLFNQGLNSIELLSLDEEARKNLRDLLENQTNLTNPISENKYKIVYGIVSKKPKSHKSDNLPIFSRISLMRTVTELRRMRFAVSIVFIRDKVNRKGKIDTKESA